MSFSELGLKSELIDALLSLNISEPTPIQTLSIPAILNGMDIIAEAQTGTGKTFAFLLPMFQNIDNNNNNIQGLIIAPTRELALQITDVAKSLSNITPLNILAVYGGQDVKAQLHKLKGNVQLVIGTPGRLLDYLRRGLIDFTHLQTLVLDEADQMLNIGFLEEVNSIINQLPNSKQTLFFSATINRDVNKFAYRYLSYPMSVKAPKEQITLDNIKQIVIETSNLNKLDDFKKLLNKISPKKAIIFCRSRKVTHSLYEELLKVGYNVDVLHGALTQAKRESTMNDFKNNKIQYLVATDIASRGLDVDGVSHVFNYNLPDDTETYIHRIGRTGRAGNAGVAYTVLTKRDEKRLDAIEEFIKLNVERLRYSEYEIDEVKTPKEKKKVHKHVKRTEKPSQKKRKRKTSKPRIQ
ncbi:MAG: DEAD/DEAH box helicase [Clostridiales bacterium]|nr:DEAD/DEAH box helicase [Clostridiales bacterium]